MTDRRFISALCVLLGVSLVGWAKAVHDLHVVLSAMTSQRQTVRLADADGMPVYRSAWCWDAGPRAWPARADGKCYEADRP